MEMETAGVEVVNDEEEAYRCPDTDDMSFDDEGEWDDEEYYDEGDEDDESRKLAQLFEDLGRGSIARALLSGDYIPDQDKVATVDMPRLASDGERIRHLESMVAKYKNDARLRTAGEARAKRALKAIEGQVAYLAEGIMPTRAVEDLIRRVKTLETALAKAKDNQDVAKLKQKVKDLQKQNKALQVGMRMLPSTRGKMPKTGDVHGQCLPANYMPGEQEYAQMTHGELVRACLMKDKSLAAWEKAAIGMTGKRAKK